MWQRGNPHVARVFRYNESVSLEAFLEAEGFWLCGNIEASDAKRSCTFAPSTIPRRGPDGRLRPYHRDHLGKWLPGSGIQPPCCCFAALVSFKLVELSMRSGEMIREVNPMEISVVILAMISAGSSYISTSILEKFWCSHCTILGKLSEQEACGSSIRYSCRRTYEEIGINALGLSRPFNSWRRCSKSPPRPCELIMRPGTVEAVAHMDMTRLSADSSKFIASSPGYLGKPIALSDQLLCGHLAIMKDRSADSGKACST